MLQGRIDEDENYSINKWISFLSKFHAIILETAGSLTVTNIVQNKENQILKNLIYCCMVQRPINYRLPSFMQESIFSRCF